MADEKTRYNKLCAERDAIMAKTLPMRVKRDKLTNDAAAAAKPIQEQITALEKPLPALFAEISTLARALGGKSMGNA